MIKRIFVVRGFYVILPFLFCLFAYAQIPNPGQRVKKEPSQVSAVEVVRAKFGSGPNDIGIVTSLEANPEGPMSFFLGSGGEIFALDQINSRIQVFKEGKRIRTIPIPFKTFMDIDVLPDGKIALLDNLVKKAIYFLDPNGKLTHNIPLVGENVPNASEVIGIYTVHSGDLAGMWLDLGDRSVRIASLEGKAIADRILISGKLTLNGKHLIRAERIGDVTAIIYHTQEKFSTWSQHTITFDMYLAYLLGLWDDRSGRIYLGVFLGEGANASNIFVVLTPEGKELGRAELFVQKMPHEIHRSVRVSPDGHIYQMALDENCVFVTKYSLTY